MKHVCVIGGSGFIGTYLVKRLLADGRRVTVIGRKETAPFTNENLTYLFHHLNRPALLFKSLEGIDEVIDLSYSTTPQTSYVNPVKDIVCNLEVTVELFEILIKQSIKKIVYVSSGGTVYGQPLQLPIREDHPTDPISPYGITKLAIEKYAQMYHVTSELPVVIVRPANAYGEGQAAFSGQGFVSTAIAALINRQVLRIYGTPETARDYIYVDDVATGIIAALKYGEIGENYNIGSGIGRTNMEVLSAIEELVGRRCQVDLLPQRAFDVTKNILDATKLRTASGWAPHVDFSIGLKKTLEWQLSQTGKSA